MNRYAKPVTSLSSFTYTSRAKFCNKTIFTSEITINGLYPTEGGRSGLCITHIKTKITSSSIVFLEMRKSSASINSSHLIMPKLFAFCIRWVHKTLKHPLLSKTLKDSKSTEMNMWVSITQNSNKKSGLSFILSLRKGKLYTKLLTPLFWTRPTKTSVSRKRASWKVLKIACSKKALQKMLKMSKTSLSSVELLMKIYNLIFIS